MGLFDRFRRKYRPVEDWAELIEGRVRLRGVVEPLAALADPLHGQPCIAVEYRAWPPSTTVGVDGGTMYNARAFQVSAVQMVDFVLLRGHERVLVQAAEGRDVATLHRNLIDQYGVGLRAEVDLIAPGTEVEVVGAATSAQRGSGSPMRTEPYRAVIVAHQVFRAA